MAKLGEPSLGEPGGVAVERSADHAAGVHGRAAELARIAAFLDEVATRPVALLIEGEAGIGKTGIDGISDGTVERVGIDEACSNGAASYTAWYQMVPAMLNPAPMFHPVPGDQVQAGVTSDAGVYTLSIHDLTSGKSFTVTKSCASCLSSSAEVTAGSPPGIPPADFTAVKFTGIVVTGGGVTGGLANRPGTPAS
jgi:Peptidase A4 family